MACYNTFDVGGCGCASFVVAVKGCNTAAIPGASVSVYSSNPATGGSLLTSGTADGSGHFSTSLAAGSYWVVVAGSSRFASYGQATTGTAQLVPATGFACYGAGCGIPEATPLTASVAWSGGGAPRMITMALSGSTWSGTAAGMTLSLSVATLSYSFPGALCPGGTCSGLATFVSATCPPSLDAVYTFPDGFGGTYTATITE